MITGSTDIIARRAACQLLTEDHVVTGMTRSAGGREQLAGRRQTRSTRRRRAARSTRRLLSDRMVLGTVLVTGLISVALFAYLAGATYVLQDIYGLSPQAYSFAFGLNSAGFMLFGFAGGRLCERWSEQGTLVLGLVMCLTGAAGLLAAAVFGLPVLAVILSLFTMVGGVAATLLAVIVYLATIRGRTTAPTPDVAESALPTAASTS